MTEPPILLTARNLADALIRWARERRDDDKREVAWLQHELCQARRKELAAVPEETS